MSKVLILGVSPLPFEASERHYATGLRTWQFAKPLAEDGHQVCLICCRYPEAYPEDAPSIIELEKYKVKIYLMDWLTFWKKKDIERFFYQFQPDCLVGAIVPASYRASQLLKSRIFIGNSEESEESSNQIKSIPFWADLFGHFMAEAQAKAFVAKDDGLLSDFYTHEIPILDKADKFSTVSKFQSLATLGELGLRGRLNRHTLGYEFCAEIPCGIEDVSIKLEADKKLLRGDWCQEDDILVLSSGGYNTWVDTETLFNGLSIAMRHEPKIKFVSLGGALKGHDEQTYEDFRKLAVASKFSERFRFQGWVPSEDLPYYYREADIGICVDKAIPETLLGSKARILAWMQYGIVPVCTKNSYLTYEMTDFGLKTVVKPQDAEALAKMLIELAENPKQRKIYSEIGKEFVKRYSFQETTKPLLEWVRHPKKAPDHGHAPEFARSQKYLEESYNKAQEELQQLKNSEASLRQYLQSLESSIQHLNENLQKKESYIENLGEIIANKEEILNSTQKAVNSLQLQLGYLKNLELAMSDWIEKNHELEKILIGQQQNLNEASKQINNLTAQIANREKHLSNLELVLEESQNTINELEHRLHRIESTLIYRLIRKAALLIRKKGN